MLIHIFKGDKAEQDSSTLLYRVEFSNSMFRVIFTEPNRKHRHVNYVCTTLQGVDIIFTDGQSISLNYNEIVFYAGNRPVSANDAVENIKNTARQYASQRAVFDLDG